jgi:transcription antitermination factor NusG
MAVPYFETLQTQPQWYAVYVWTRHEKRVTEQLTGKGIETFLPMYRSLRRWKNRTQVELELPLFPSYLFVHIAPSDQLRVLQSSGALSLVGSGRKPAAIPAQEIETLQSGLRVLGAEPHPYLKTGDRVRVVAGPMQGLEGVLVRWRHGYRVILSIDLIMRSVSVEVDLCNLEWVQPPTQSVLSLSAGTNGLRLEKTCG